MKKFDTKKYPIYASFLNQLAKDLTKFYYAKLDKPFKITNKMKGKGYDPVTTSDKAFEKFIRSKISKKFPNHQIIGCLLYTSPSPRDLSTSRMPSSA